MGYPTQKTIDKLYDELDFQRASQAYLWALPAVGIADLWRTNRDVFKADAGDFVRFESFDSKLGILTANLTTPYVWSFADLGKTGPIVWEFPDGPHAGSIMNLWQRGLTDVGALGPDKSQAAKYLILPPGSTQPDVPGYIMVRSDTRTVFMGDRALDPDPARGKAYFAGMHVYPFADRDTDRATKAVRIIDAGNTRWGGPVRGMEFWKLLHGVLQDEVVLERDRDMMAMLKPLGIEKGQPFSPDARQTQLLLAGEKVGEAMAKAMLYKNRDIAKRYRPDTQWETAMYWDPSHETAYTHQLDELAVYTYTALATTPAMVSGIPGVGQGYLMSFRDSHGDWFDGDKHYVLHVPADVPAKQFWALTAYDVSTRAVIDNPQKTSERSSRLPLVKNDDGTVDLYVGPDTSMVPKGKEFNWIPTLRGRSFFVWFRFYGPQEGYLKHTWKLPDLDRVPTIAKGKRS